MIEIIVKGNEFNSDYTATFTISEEATTADCFQIFTRALLANGYGTEGIRGGIEECEYDLYEGIEASYNVMKERREVS